MTSAETTIEVPNGLIYVRDPTVSLRPEIDGVGSAWWTPSCVAVSCRPDCDGETRVAIGPSDEINQRVKIVFDRTLETPGRTLAVEIVPGVEILRVSVPTALTRVRISTNGPRDTDAVAIALSER